MPKKKIEITDTKYDKSKHPLMVRKYVADHGTIYKFCIDNNISDIKFFRWIAMHEEFNEQYRIGLMSSRADWEHEGFKYHNDPDWNMSYWERLGEMRYNAFKGNKIRVNVNPDSDPHEQYKQVITQASYGDFTSSEIKQVMESINVGVRAYEVFKQQGEIDKIRDDLNKMNLNNGGHILTIESPTQTNSDSLQD